MVRVIYLYLGGRINTYRGFGTPVDLGASWIHGLDANPLSRLVSNPNLLYVLQSGQIRSSDGMHPTIEESKYMLSKVWALHDRMVSASKEMKVNISVRQFIANDKQWKIDIAEVILQFISERMI